MKSFARGMMLGYTLAMEMDPNTLLPPHGDATPALPRTSLLSYVTVVNTPTRAIRVAFASILIMSAGLMLGSAAVAVATYLYYESWFAWTRRFRGAGLPSNLFDRILETYKQVLEYEPAPLIVAAALAVAGCMLPFAAYPVRRGRRWACWAGITAAILFIVAEALGGMTAGSSGLISTFGLFRTPRELWGIVWLFTAAILAVLIGLTIDLIRILFWVSRHPITEKPRTPFLPKV